MEGWIRVVSPIPMEAGTQTDSHQAAFWTYVAMHLMGNAHQPLYNIPKCWEMLGRVLGPHQDPQRGAQDPLAPLPPPDTRFPLPAASSVLAAKPCKGRVPPDDENSVKSCCLACQAASRPKHILTQCSAPTPATAPP